MSASIRERIQAVDDRAEKDVTIPEWENITLLLIAPTSRERTEMMNRYTTVKTNTDTQESEAILNTQAMLPSLIVACAHDPETRTLAFQPDDISWLLDKNGAVVERIGMACMALAGFAQEGDDGPSDTGKDDSSMTRNGVTPSDSPAVLVAP